ncbi:MAG: extracellular matrix regulator RemB [Oscillospiraceae bacterium]
MFLFLGGEVTVNEKDVIGIFDIEECSVSRITADYLNSCQKKKKIVYVSQDMPKSFVVCADKTYISNVSNSTINLRGSKKK